MFGLWNELFGFPVNSCDYEAIECGRSYIPVLNWDKDNEFVWSLADPLEGGIDAKNVAFSTKDIQKRPASVTKVDEALELLMDRVNNKKSILDSFTLTLGDDGETLEGEIKYIDDAGQTYSKNAEINLKDIVEGWETITLQDVTADNIQVSTGSITTASITNATIANETVGESNITKATIGTEVVNKSTITELGAGQAHATSLSAVQASISREFNSNGAANFNGVNTFNTNINAKADVISEGTGSFNRLTIAELAEFNGVVRAYENAFFSKNVGIEGTANIQTLNVIGYSTFQDKSTFNEDTVFNDTATFNSNANFNGHTKLDTIEVAGQATFKDDADFDKNVNIDGNIAAEGNGRIDGTLTVGKEAEFKKNVNMQKSLNVETNIEAGGKITAPGLEVTNRATIANEEVANSIIQKLTVTDELNIPDEALEPFQARSEKDQPNGYAGLDANGKLSIEELPDDIANGMHYRGTWDPISDYPASPKLGDMYKVIAEGEKSGREFHVGDAIVYNGSSWDLIPSADDVISVNGRRGIVTGLEEVSNKIDHVNKVSPSSNKYTSEVAVAEVIADVESVSDDVVALTSAVENKADKTSVYTKIETDQKIEDGVAQSQAFQDLEAVVATKAGRDYVDGQLNLKANVANVYDKDVMDQLLADKAHITHTHTIAQVSGLSERLGTIEGNISAVADEIDDLEDEVNDVKDDIISINNELDNKVDKDPTGKIPVSELPDTVVTTDILPDAIRAALTSSMIEAKLGVAFKTLIIPLVGTDTCYSDGWISQRANVLWTWTGELQGHIAWSVEDGKVCVTSTTAENGNFYITLVQQA